VIELQRYLANVYIPGPNAVDDPTTVVRLLRAAGVGHLISHDTADSGGQFDATMLPFLVDDDLRVARAHVARANPQWRSVDGRPVLLVVPVSDAYVSPSWYPSKQIDGRVVPTWNYEVVHLHGIAHVRDDSTFVERVVRELTDRHEGDRSGRDAAPAWSVDDAPIDYIKRQLRAIVGVEIEIDRIEAKRKLSQNRSEADRAGVEAGLSTSPRAGDTAIAQAMQRNA
jgi:transcriptional regulator